LNPLIDWIGWLCNIFGTILSFSGGIVMLKGTPEDKLNIDTDSYTQEVLYMMQGDDYGPAKQLRKRKRLSRLGVKMITVGFFFQLLSVIFQVPK
jgi:hypothetical protein